MTEKEHRWVKHTITPIIVYPPDTWGKFQAMPSGTTQTTLGCDDCGLPLTVATFSEPCLSELEDQLEKMDSEEGD